MGSSRNPRDSKWDNLPSFYLASISPLSAPELYIRRSQLFYKPTPSFPSNQLLFPQIYGGAASCKPPRPFQKGIASARNGKLRLRRWPDCLGRTAKRRAVASSSGLRLCLCPAPAAAWKATNLWRVFRENKNLWRIVPSNKDVSGIICSLAR